MTSELTLLRDRIVALEREIDANTHRQSPQSGNPAVRYSANPLGEWNSDGKFHGATLLVLVPANLLPLKAFWIGIVYELGENDRLLIEFRARRPPTSGGGGSASPLVLY